MKENLFTECEILIFFLILKFYLKLTAQSHILISNVLKDFRNNKIFSVNNLCFIINIMST